MGATATGKSELAIYLAHRLGGEVVSMDSRQVYRGMDIGTAKVLPDEREGIPHHLIDILDPSETNNAGEHARRAFSAVEDIESRGVAPILAGGTGLYFRALFQGLVDVGAPAAALKKARDSLAASSTSELYSALEKHDPERAARLSPNDRQRIIRALEVFVATGKPLTHHFEEQGTAPVLEPFKIVLTMPRAALRDRITARTHMMFEAGWVDEVRRLMALGHTSRSPGLVTIGYKEISEAIETRSDPMRVCDRVTTLTHQYAKRQETFFRKERGAVWYNALDPMMNENIIKRLSREPHFKNNLT